MRSVQIHVLGTESAPAPARAPLRKRKLVLGQMVTDREAGWQVLLRGSFDYCLWLLHLFLYVPELLRLVICPLCSCGWIESLLLDVPSVDSFYFGRMDSLARRACSLID